MRSFGQNPGDTKVDALYRIMLIVWLALLSSIGFYFLITYLVRAEGEPEAGGNNDVLFWALLALGVSTVALSFLIKRKLLARSVTDQQPALVLTGSIIAWALAEAATLFGLVLFFATRENRSYLLMALGALAMLLHLPRRQALVDASFKGQSLGSTRGQF